MDDTIGPKVRPIYSVEWGDQLQADYDEYMGRLYEGVDAEEFDDSLVDASGEYFCGCSDCERRASWTFLMIRIMESYRDGAISLEVDPPAGP